jgi:hypothetical protein
LRMSATELKRLCLRMTPMQVFANAFFLSAELNTGVDQAVPC